MISQERVLKVVLAPHISEKSSAGSEAKRQYTFKVAIDATKPEVRQAVSQLFNVKVDSVRMIKMKGKSTRFGRTQGKRSDWKKAMITLCEGSEIDMAAEA